MIPPTRPLTAALAAALFLIAPAARSDEPISTAARSLARASRPPRKVVVGTAIYGPYGTYDGLDERLKTISGLVDEMAGQAARQRPGHGLDLAILPESVVTSSAGSASERGVPLAGRVRDTFRDLARKHHCYVLVPFDLAEERAGKASVANAAVLFDRTGEVVGIYRKVHPVAYVGGSEFESGITPGQEFPVFDCDFGKLGVQICWDLQFDEGWQALADKGAEIVAWPTASPATVLPAARAARHRYFVVSSTWRNNATVYEPTGMVAARIEQPARVLVHELDLSHAILGWTAFLENGEALRKRYGDRVGFHYDAREDMGLFWSNDPAQSIGDMVRSIGGEILDAQVERNRRLYDAERGKGAVMAIKATTRNPADRVRIDGAKIGIALTVTSPGGIGRATLERASERWPDRITVQLQLKALESLKLSNGTVMVCGSAWTHGLVPAPPTLLRDGQPEQPLDRRSPFWIDVRFVLANPGSFEFTLPGALVEPNPKTITIDWIDFHR